MHAKLRLATASLALGLSLCAARAADPGYVDLGKFTPADGCEYVEVNLQPSILKFASMFVGKEDRQAAELLRNLKQVRVNVVGYNDATRAETADHVAAIRRELTAQGWEQIVTVRHSPKDEDVAIYVKPHGDDAIAGLVVTVIDASKREAVVVNIVGNLKPEQLANLGRGLHIEPLEKLGAAPAKKGA